MGPYYQYDDTNLFLALWRNQRMCQYVSDTGDVVFFENANGFGVNNTFNATNFED